MVNDLLGVAIERVDIKPKASPFEKTWVDFEFFCDSGAKVSQHLLFLKFILGTNALRSIEGRDGK